MKAIASVAIFLFILITNPAAKASRLRPWCSTHEQCPAVGSLCEDGRCSNPFVNGCLQSKMAATTTSSAGTLEDLREENIETSTSNFKPRVCNSDDAGDINSDTSTSCVKPTFPYKEVRIAPGNWDSSILVSIV